RRAGGGGRRDRVDADDLGGERTISGPGPAAADQHGHGKYAADDSASGADLTPPLGTSPIAHVRAPGRGPTCPPTATCHAVTRWVGVDDATDGVAPVPLSYCAPPNVDHANAIKSDRSSLQASSTPSGSRMTFSG